MLGDLHNRVFGEGNSQLVEIIRKQYPDLIFSVGDLTVCHAGQEVNPDIGLALLKRLACDCPVYCVNGNHEYRAKQYPKVYGGVYQKITAELHKGGITLLENARVPVEVNGARLMIHGLEIPEKYYKRFGSAYMPAEEIRALIGEPDEERYNILLAHNPVFFESYALWGANLTLSGHLHGGLVRLPFIGGVISPQVKLFPRYAQGMFEKYRHKMVVTAGLGSHSLALRVNNPPEIVVLEIV
ncbi:hypothetical protein BRYFOR_09843 [Marvinbryantia formatexigens DSM 14469]|uniref:Calcineurin-like phosphoesterase domain-containing protein n=2 Tax=Marvinbryantia TaxID=248744 RepID=C6LME3_9FIRM|nr:metallophosphoesterase [Marvinbryantia formatexigens]EET58204.1 hypothetical protein BRYFOR_09843 [Marvinbryantia formatexigens DSM 14469]SDG91394.1 hypothetical protein SAMN05660368_03506 [Marvinbryantia formatexigens]